MSDHVRRLGDLDEEEGAKIIRDMAQELMYQLESLREKYKVDKEMAYFSMAEVFVHISAFLCIHYQEYSLDPDLIVMGLKNEIAQYIKSINEANEGLK